MEDAGKAQVICAHCGDLGMAIQEWTDAPHDFAVCVCRAGDQWRNDDNNGRTVTPAWRVWCAREQVDPSRVFMLEDIYTAQELAAAGLSRQVADINREARLLASSRRRK